MAEFRTHPPVSDWDNYVDFESTSWPKKDRRNYWIIPSICFNCESACGILAYVDKDTLNVRKIEGNPVHPGSRGRTCAKGVVTPNQLEDPDRILYPLKRVGKRGEGKWERVTWNEVLDTISARVRAAITEDRKREIMYVRQHLDIRGEWSRSLRKRLQLFLQHLEYTDPLVIVWFGNRLLCFGLRYRRFEFTSHKGPKHLLEVDIAAAGDGFCQAIKLRFVGKGRDHKFK